MAVCVDGSQEDRRVLAEARRLGPERLSSVEADRVLAWAREERPDLVVAAWPAGQALGGVARHLATSAPCPALILPPGVEPGPEPAGGEAPYAHVACCIDDSAASTRALAEARRLRALGPGRLSLVHVAPRALIEAPAGGAGSAVPRDIADDDRRWLAGVAGGVAGAEPVALTGLAAEAAIDWAREVAPDLMVAAAHRGPVERVLLGSFAAHLAREAPCPALLTR